MTSNLGIGDAQNLSSSFAYPINISNIPNLYNLTIPEKLPEVVRNEEEKENETINKDTIFISKNRIIDQDWVLNITTQLQNILNQIPRYSIPPLINVDTTLNKHVEKRVNEIINDNNFEDLNPPKRQRNGAHLDT